jgi:hypothetical protein
MSGNKTVSDGLVSYTGGAEAFGDEQTEDTFP